MAFTPSITTPRTLDLKSVQQAVDNIREAMRTLDARIAAIPTSSPGAANDLRSLQGQLSVLQAALGGTSLLVLQTMLAGADGLVVLSGDSLITRTLTPGTNITITYPDGVGGNPVINSTATGGGGADLHDETGRALFDDLGVSLTGT